ncbi:MAG: hypothetical protein GYB68_18120, partial [Chloroflexi bacterium]|nr:hypothetical protein [Chloroflexota bacterium]
GHSHGGYTAVRVALHDARVKALIPSTPLINADAGGKAMFEPLLPLMGIVDHIPSGVMDSLLDWRLSRDPVMHAFVNYTLWTIGMMDISAKDLINAFVNGAGFNVEDQLDQIDCAVLALAGEGEGEELIRQTHTFFDGVSSQIKDLKVFTLAEDGSDDHCQLDNRTRANQVVFDWLDDLWDYRAARQVGSDHLIMAI